MNIENNHNGSGTKLAVAHFLLSIITGLVVVLGSVFGWIYLSGLNAQAKQNDYLQTEIDKNTNLIQNNATQVSQLANIVSSLQQQVTDIQRMDTETNNYFKRAFGLK